MTAQCGDADFSDSFRNPGNLVGVNPNVTDNIEDRYLKIAEQRQRIIESFLAEHAGLLPSQIAQVITTLPSGDVQWHLEVRT